MQDYADLSKIALPKNRLSGGQIALLAFSVACWGSVAYLLYRG